METYRAAPSAFVIFGVLFGAIALLWIAAAYVSGAPWTPALVPLGAFVLVSLWLSRFRLTFAPDRLSYATLLTSPRSLPIDAIVSVEPLRQMLPWDSPLTVVVRSRAGEEIRVNTKVFSREAVSRLLALGKP
jgi:hypothetical protein